MDIQKMKSIKTPPPVSELLEKYKREREVLDNNPDTTDINVTELTFLAYGLDFIDWARANFDVALTLIESDIEIVEQMAEQAHMAYTSGKLPEEGLLEFAKTFAGYMGLLILIHKGGKWAQEAKTMEDSGPVIMQDNGKVYHICGRTFHRIKEGSEYNLLHYYQVVDYAE